MPSRSIRSGGLSDTGKLTSAELGELLRIARISAGFTEEEAGAALGMPVGKLSYVELGFVDISATLFCQILQLYGWDPRQVFATDTVSARRVRQRMARELRASANELLEAANQLDTLD